MTYHCHFSTPMAALPEALRIAAQAAHKELGLDGHWSDWTNRKQCLEWAMKRKREPGADNVGAAGKQRKLSDDAAPKARKREREPDADNGESPSKRQCTPTAAPGTTMGAGRPGPPTDKETIEILRAKLHTAWRDEVALRKDVKAFEARLTEACRSRDSLGREYLGAQKELEAMKERERQTEAEKAESEQKFGQALLQEIFPGHSKWAGVAEPIERSGNVRVIKIISVVNPYQNAVYKLFQVRTRNTDGGHADCVIDGTFYHGTTEECARLIAVTRLSRSHTGVGSGRCSFGRGVYVADKPAYSLHRDYARPDADGNQTLLVVSACPGRSYGPGQPSYREAPAGYSSCTNYDNDIRVLFCDEQCAVRYIVTCAPKN